MKKRLISMLTAFAVIVSALFCFNVSIVFAASSTSGYCGESGSIFNTGKNASFNYDEATKTLTISGTGATKDYGDTVANRTPWFDYKDEIETVVVEEGITEIGTLNFYNFISLTSVSLPKTLTTIAGNAANYGAFRGCTALQSITLPQNLTTIEAMAFRECTALKSIVIPDSVTSLGASAFQNCTSLETVTFGTGLKSTGERAFRDTGIKRIIFSPTITEISDYSFYNTRLTTIEIPEEITSIGSFAFQNCTFLYDVWVYNPNTTFGGTIDKNPFKGSQQQITFHGHSSSTTEMYVTDNPNDNYVFVSLDKCAHKTTHEVITDQPTCTEKGKTTQVCDECGFVVSTADIPALGHQWELAETYDETEENGHILSLYKCTRCGEEKGETKHVSFVDGYYEISQVNGLGDLSSITDLIQNAIQNGEIASLDELKNILTGGGNPCKTSKVQTYTCAFPDCGKRELKVLPPSHTVDYTVTTEPTCTEKGQEEGICSVCGEKVTRDIEALGHQNVLVDEYDNTFEDGHKYQIYSCSVCGENTVVTEHIEWVDGCYTSQETPSVSCTVGTIRYDTCAVESCKQTRTVYLPSTIDHEWEENGRTEPDCTSAGKITYVCKNCGNTKTERIEALGHDNELTDSKEPTCTEDGFNTWRCKRCGASSKNIVHATGHTPSEEITIIKEPTCTEEGLSVSTCTVCGEKDFPITLEAPGHNYEDVITPADKPGHSIVTPTCTRCGDKKDSSTRHDEWIEGRYKTTVITKGSCVIDEITADTCNDCRTTRTNTTPAPGHKYVFTGVNDEGKFSFACDVCGNIDTVSPTAVKLLWKTLWDVGFINHTPSELFAMGIRNGHRFELNNDGIVNAKDYSILLKATEEDEEPGVEATE